MPCTFTNFFTEYFLANILSIHPTILNLLYHLDDYFIKSDPSQTERQHFMCYHSALIAYYLMVTRPLDTNLHYHNNFLPFSIAITLSDPPRPKDPIVKLSSLTSDPLRKNLTFWQPLFL